jgi:hypothetical protein
LRRDISNERCFPKIKNPPERLAREGPFETDDQISLTRDLSHEPGVRHRLAASHSTVGRAFRIRVASQGSCYSRTLLFAKAAGDTPERCECQPEPVSKLEQPVRILDTHPGLTEARARAIPLSGTHTGSSAESVSAFGPKADIITKPACIRYSCTSKVC